MSNLQIFKNAQFGEVRVIMKGNEPWFVAIDACRILDIANPTDALKRLDEDERARFNLGRQGETNIVNEPGLYSLVLGSRKPEAKEFKRWLTHEVIPAIRETGSYELPKSKPHGERLASVNNAVKILLPLLKQAGCDSKIQLLTAKSLYEKSGVVLPIEIKAEKKYYDTKYIARQCGIYTKANKPAYQAVSMILKKLDIREDQYADTWETNGNWQGTVRKFDESVILAVQKWLAENNYPQKIDYVQCDGQAKQYHVFYKDAA